MNFKALSERIEHVSNCIERIFYALIDNPVSVYDKQPHRQNSVSLTTFSHYPLIECVFSRNSIYISREESTIVYCKVFATSGVLINLQGKCSSGTF